MSFLGKLGKDLGRAAEQAKFEADKALKVNRLGSEVGEFTNQVQKATASIGAKVMELHKAGTLQIPDLDAMIEQVHAAEAQLAAKKAELEATRAMQFGHVSGPSGTAPAAATAASGFPPAATRAPEGMAPIEGGAVPKFCPNCGAATESAKFCPGCGQKLG